MNPAYPEPDERDISGRTTLYISELEAMIQAIKGDPNHPMLNTLLRMLRELKEFEKRKKSEARISSKNKVTIIGIKTLTGNDYTVPKCLPTKGVVEASCSSLMSKVAFRGIETLTADHSTGLKCLPTKGGYKVKPSSGSSFGPELETSVMFCLKCLTGGKTGKCEMKEDYPGYKSSHDKLKFQWKQKNNHRFAEFVRSWIMGQSCFAHMTDDCVTVGNCPHNRIHSDKFDFHEMCKANEYLGSRYQKWYSNNHGGK